MFDYTFCSTDPDHFNEVECPVNYLGVSTQLKWYVSSINTYFSVAMFSPEDYIEFCIGFSTYSKTYRFYLQKNYKDRDESGLINDLIDLFKTELGEDFLTITTDELGRIKFMCKNPFDITSVSYGLKQALGLFYKKNITPENPVNCEEKYGTYIIQAKAIGYNNLTPIWYLLSNLGSPDVINTMNDPYEMYYPAIAMKIQNTFSPDQPIQYTNGDFMSISQASALANLRVKLVDINLKPVKLLSPLIVTVSFFEMAEEHAEIEEAMADQESNPDIKKAIEEKRKTNYKNLIDNLNKRMKGVASDNEDLEAPEEQRGSEMAQNIQAKNEETEATVQAQDIHED